MLGFTPKGLDDWEAYQLSDLLEWLQDGIMFQNGTEQWQAASMREVLTGLDRIQHALGHNRQKTKAIIGLDQRPLPLILNTGKFNPDLPDSQGTAIANDTRSSTNRTLSMDITFYTINAAQYDESDVQGLIHEIGHLVDNNARQFAAPGTGLWKFSESIGGSWATAAGWAYDCPGWTLTTVGREGAVSRYAAEGQAGVFNDPNRAGPLIAEDFAETFNWFVEDANGVPFRPSGGPKLKNDANRYGGRPNDERIQVIKDLLARF